MAPKTSVFFGFRSVFGLFLCEKEGIKNKIGMILFCKCLIMNAQTILCKKNITKNITKNIIVSIFGWFILGTMVHGS